MTLLHGYDFSAYQGLVVPDADFGWVKTSEGTAYHNSKFTSQWASALTHWKVPGVYHFAHPELSSAGAQVDAIAHMVELTAGKHTVMLDLETSKLSQGKTNEWAKQFGVECRKVFKGVTSFAYFSGTYATNGTGRGLAEYFDFWVYPQYPGAYRVPLTFSEAETLDEARALNRSDFDERRYALGPPKSNWPTSMAAMYLPSGASGNTGWPHGPAVWQFSDNHAPGGLDASVSGLTLQQMLGSGDVVPTIGAKEMPGDVPPLKVGERHTYTGVKGAVNVWGIGFDSLEKLTYRIAAHKSSGKGVVKELVVGGVASDTDSWPKKTTWSVTDTDVDWWSIELVKCEGPATDWDPTKPDRNGKIVRPFWDASHK